VPASARNVGRIAAGQTRVSFGELGLVSNAPRSATIKMEEPCEFLTVSKADFEVTLKVIYYHSIP
jgi:CRP-like cAMP-binding protein